MRGTIKWYSPAKGFGWIIVESGEEVFVHFSVLRFPDRRDPVAGEAVLLEVVEGPQGKQALKVRPGESRA